MNDPHSARITTLKPREAPAAQKLIDELREAITAASAMGVFTRLRNCYQVRRCLWSHQALDGRLCDNSKDLPVFRWKGAPDLRIPLADTIVRWLGLLRMSVFNRGDRRIAPRQAQPGGGASTQVASLWQTTMDYFLSVQDWMFAKSYELFCSCVDEFGYGLMIADWEKKQRNEKCQVTMQSLTDSLLETARDELLGQIASTLPEGDETDPASLITPEMESQLVQQVTTELQAMLAMATDPTPEQLTKVMLMDARMTESEAVKVLRALRRKPVEPAEYYAARDDGGVPVADAYVPWVSCLHSVDMLANRPGQADFIAVPKFYSEARLRELALVNGWNKGALEELIRDHKNKFWSEIMQGTMVDLPKWALMGTGVDCEPDMTAMEKAPRWLVVHLWRRVTDRQGLPMVCKAVLSPHMTSRLLLWEPTDLEELPVVCDTAEPCTYVMLARGVPDVVVDKQNANKDTLDGEAARGQLGSNPPLLRTGGQNVGIKPGIEMYAKKSGQSYDGTRFLEVPVVDQGALKIVDKLEEMVNRYYFRGKDVDPVDAQMFREGVIFASRRSLMLLIRVMWRIVQEHIDNAQASRINGRDVQLGANRDQLLGEAAVNIGVHLEGYDKEASGQFIDNLTKLMQADRAGVIDWSEAINIAAQLHAPTYASRLVQPTEVASKKIIDDQENRIAKMYAGVPVQYEEFVTAPQLRQKVMKGWAEMPGNLDRLGTDPAFAVMMSKEEDSLIYQEDQQINNPVTGRTGVKPNKPAAA